MKLAQRMAGIAPFHVMELVARAKELEASGRSIIHMEVGEPDFPTPHPIIDAAARFIADGKVFYTHALGLPDLREAISAFYGSRYGVAVAPERIVVTSGASAALLLALATMLDPGDEVLLADPGYPCNRNFGRLLDARPVGIPVDSASNYQPTPEQVASHWTSRTRTLLLASPSNPTGTLLSLPEIVALRAQTSALGGHLIVDEIYHGLTYGTDAETALGVADDVFVINSFSKYFGMTGWRLGWLVVPESFLRPVEKLAQNLYIAPSTPAQHAALASFRPETIAILEERRRAFQARRDVLLPGLRQLGFEIRSEPRGAFYLYAGLGGIEIDSFDLAKQLIETAGVAATPGLDFGTNAPGRHMRFAYTVAEDHLAEGLRRIGKLLNG